MHKSQWVREFFRSFFLGNGGGRGAARHVLRATVDDERCADLKLVEVMLGRRDDLRQLYSLCDLLTSIQESAGVVKVREVIPTVQERRERRTAASCGMPTSAHCKLRQGGGDIDALQALVMSGDLDPLTMSFLELHAQLHAPALRMRPVAVALAIQ